MSASWYCWRTSVQSIFATLAGDMEGKWRCRGKCVAKRVFGDSKRKLLGDMGLECRRACRGDSLSR